MIDRNATGNKQPCRYNVKGVIAWGNQSLNSNSSNLIITRGKQTYILSP